MAVTASEISKNRWLLQLRTGCAVARFDSRPIPDQTMEEILEAGCRTTSPWNLQPWQFIVVRTEAARAELIRHCPDPGPATSAPVLMVGVGNPRAWKQAPERLAELIRNGVLPPGQDVQHLERIQRRWSVGDTARVFAIAQTYAALQQVCLAALACTVCSHWVHEFDPAAVTSALHIPEHLVVVGIVALGYCEQATPQPLASIGRSVFAEAFGLPWPRPGEKQPESSARDSCTAKRSSTTS
ncbi:MAG: nitroreductase family protein [Candidatus Acidoferrales bacterium]